MLFPKTEYFAELLNNHLEKAILPGLSGNPENQGLFACKGCKNTIMSGSGPSVFGIYDCDIDLSNAKLNGNAFKVKTIGSGVKLYS